MPASKGRNYNYEGMFLVSQAVAADLGSVVDHIKEILSRASAELIAMKKWDDRRLAYEIQKHKRGVYILTYFSCDPVNIVGIERDCSLSETVLRAMIMRADHLTVEEMQAADGQTDLATEIKLRGEEAARAESETADASA
ncbi:MAG: 30S ribosomal protein S6 [Phycisphaerales bacterium]|nr:30S ribosomal protein S6 [Phycisphaerales bacterium]